MIKLDEEKYYQTTNMRLKKFLYLLGYEFEIYINDTDACEIFVFEIDDKFYECIDFYVNMRHKDER